MTLELTNQEAKTLIALLDLATKSGGLDVAQHSFPLAVKIQNLIDKENNDVPNKD